MSFVDRATCEAAFAACMSPTWIMDSDPNRILWANPAGLELWRADSLDELRGRDLVAGTPQAVLDRTSHLFAQLRAGRVMREEFVLYPRGKPVPILQEFRAVELGGGRIGALIQALPMAELSPTHQRSIAIFRHSGLVSALVEANGVIASQNPAATRVFGQRERWPQWLDEAAEGPEMLAACLAGSDQTSLCRVRSELGPAWHLVALRAVRDPVSAELAVLVEHIDVSAQVEAERLAEARGERIDALSSALELVERQRREILELSAPALEVAPQTLAVPLIGQLQRERVELLTARLLELVSRRQVAAVILDLTGVDDIDLGSAGHLDQLIRALELLGAQPILTGVRPALALAWTKAGVELGGRAVFRSLAEGLRHVGHDRPRQ